MLFSLFLPSIASVPSVLFSVSLLLSWLVVINANREIFTNSFYVKLNEPYGKNDAHQIAKKNGFINLGSVS